MKTWRKLGGGGGRDDDDDDDAAASSDRWSVFRGADAIVGVHGAGLANVLYAAAAANDEARSHTTGPRTTPFAM